MNEYIKKMVEEAAKHDWDDLSLQDKYIVANNVEYLPEGYQISKPNNQESTTMRMLTEYTDAKGPMSENPRKHIANEQGGVKFDKEKPRPSLIPFDSMQDVIDVLEIGARQYGPDNWQKVERERYVDALLRHVFAYARGQKIDPDSNKPHLAHIVCCALFLIWHDKQ